MLVLSQPGGCMAEHIRAVVENSPTRARAWPPRVDLAVIVICNGPPFLLIAGNPGSRTYRPGGSWKKRAPRDAPGPRLHGRRFGRGLRPGLAAAFSSAKCDGRHGRHCALGANAPSASGARKTHAEAQSMLYAG